MELIFIMATLLSVVLVAYQADKNKNKDKKSLSYKLSKSIANILNFTVFLDTNDVNNIVKDIEDNK